MLRALVLALVAIGAFIPITCLAMSTEQIDSLKLSVIEMCRGGMTERTRIHVEALSRGSLVTIENVFESEGNAEILLSTDIWSGIEALMIDDSKYIICVQYSLDVRVPAITTKRNIDTDIYAPMEYIESPVFCNNLVYAIRKHSQISLNSAQEKKLSKKTETDYGYLAVHS